jgi:hypothetical protein
VVTEVLAALNAGSSAVPLIPYGKSVAPLSHDPAG